MRKFTLLITLMVAAIATYAQQWDSLPRLITGTDTAEYIYHIRGIGSKVYYCSDKGLFASADNGDTWSNVTFAATNTAGKAIRSVYYDSTGSKLYAGGDSALFVSADLGNTWSVAYQVGDRVNDIIRSGNRLLVAYGAFGRGGALWSDDAFTTANTTTDTMPKDVFYIDGTNTFLGGVNGVYKSTDNGSTWTLAGTGFPASCRFFSMVSLGGTYFAGDVYGNGLYISSDNGATWSNRDSVVFHDFCQVFSMVETGGRIVLSIDGACNNSDPIKTSTDGTAWSSYLGNLTPAYYSMLGLNSSGSCIFTFYRNRRMPFRYCTSTGIADLATADATLSPNPAHSSLTVRTGAAGPAAIRVISTAGQVLSELGTSTGTAQLDISTYAAGVYIVQIVMNDQVRTARFVKQ